MMIWPIALGLVVCILLFLWIRGRGGVYKAIFADAHYIEVAQGIQQVKTAAIAGIATDDDARPTPQDDPRVLQTSANLIVYYTINESDAGFVHHASISMMGPITPHAVGESFTFYIATLLGLDPSRASLQVSESHVFHMELILSQTEQALFAARTIEIPTAENIQTIREECQRLREGVRFEPMVTGVRD